MSRGVLEFLIWQLDEAFERKPEHSLLANLSSIVVDELDLLPPSGGRTIRDFVAHCASVKRMHANHAFGDRRLSWWTTWDGSGKMEEASLEELTGWLRRAQAEVVDGVTTLKDDSELLGMRPTHWGEERETRLLIDAVIMHDIYHAGEMNHLRGLLQNADHFPKGGTN